MSGGGGSGSSMYSGDALAPAPAGSESAPASGDPGICESLRFVARLRAVDPDEADLIEVGDPLAVVYQATPRPAILVYRLDGAGYPVETPLGSLLSRLAELLQCLDYFQYVATVVSINGGDVRVRVEPYAPIG